MRDLLSFAEFAIDVVTMMPPIEAVESIGVSRDHAMFAAIAGVLLLAMSMVVGGFREAVGGSALPAVLIFACVCGIGFVGLGREAVESIFVVAYPPMVMAIRLGEGLIIGQKVRLRALWWVTPAFVGFVVVLYSVVSPMPEHSIAIAKGVWALLGTGVAAFLWSRMISGSPMVEGPVAFIGVFVMFASTLLYVAASPAAREIFRWTLPVGLVLGIALRAWGSPQGARAEQPGGDSA